MNYTLNQLRIFLKVVEKRSITKAAEELHLTQPAVSIQLKNFQEQFDIPLIENLGRKIYITEFGEEIASSCQVILEEVEYVESKKMAYLKHIVGKLKVSVVSTGKYVMPYFFTDFMQKYPGIQLNIEVTNKAMVVRSLERNEVDYALVSVIPKGLAIDKISLMQNKLYLVGKKGPKHNLKRPDDFSKVPLIFRENGSATRLAMEAYIKNYKVNLGISLELTSNEAVKQAVLASLGYSIMPLIGLRNEIRNQDLEIIEMKGLPIVTDWNLIRLKNKSYSPAAMAFKNYILEAKDKIVSDQFFWYQKY